MKPRLRVPAFTMAALLVACIAWATPALGAATDQRLMGRSPRPVSAHVLRQYQDPLGFTITVPSRWHILRFHIHKGKAWAFGVLVSNVKLPTPRMVPGFPIQMGARVPLHGVSLIFAKDHDPHFKPRRGEEVFTPPLGLRDFSYGNGNLATLWFKHGHRRFACSFEESKASVVGNHFAGVIVRSLHF